jgi:hypothetical protein
LFVSKVSEGGTMTDEPREGAPPEDKEVEAHLLDPIGDPIGEAHLQPIGDPIGEVEAHGLPLDPIGDPIGDKHELDEDDVEAHSPPVPPDPLP